MSQSPVTVTYSLEEVLKEINRKLDNIQEDITDLKVGQAKLTEKVESIDNRLRVVEGTQKNQVWTLIVLLIGAIATASAKLFGIIGNP